MVDEELIKKSKEYVEKIYCILDGRKIKKDKLREFIVAGFLSISRDHHCAIISLLEKGIYSSSFALLRPLIDAIYRGLWVSQVASEEEIEKIYSTEYKFETSTFKYVDKIDKENNTNVFHKRYKQMAPFLHDMTHCGIGQLARQFSENGDFIQSNFSENDLKNLINHINAHIAIFLYDYNRYQTDNELESLAKKILNIEEE
jgi:hypothetical protein